MVGQRLRKMREERGLSQEELASAAGVRQGNISRLERGKVASPGIDLLSKVAAGLGVSVEELTGKPAVQALTEREWAAARAALDRLLPSDQRMILSIARRLAVAGEVVDPDLRDLDDAERETVLSSPPELRLAVANALRQLRQRDREAGPLGERLEQQPQTQVRRERPS